MASNNDFKFPVQMAPVSIDIKHSVPMFFYGRHHVNRLVGVPGVFQPVALYSLICYLVVCSKYDAPSFYRDTLGI